MIALPIIDSHPDYESEQKLKRIDHEQKQLEDKLGLSLWTGSRFVFRTVSLASAVIWPSVVNLLLVFQVLI